jgi:2-iminobutanoate/2-iminopropanoate deaminase
MNNMKHLTDIPNTPLPVGPYSIAVAANGFLFTSGQIGLVPETGALAGTDVVSQTEQVLRNLTAVLNASGCSLNDVVKATIFLTDLNDFAVVNELYSRAIGDAKPARSTIQVAALPKGAVVEIELIAAIKEY